jgi:hypothetical protein
LFFFVLIPSHPPVVLFCLFFVYAFSGYFLWLWRFVKRKRVSPVQQGQQSPQPQQPPSLHNNP